MFSINSTVTLLLSLLLLLCPAGAQDLLPGQSVDADGDPCWEDMRELDNYEAMNVTDPEREMLREYILCPDTIFQVGFLATDGGGFQGGAPPFFLTMNQHILCGKDGSSENNCVVSDGTYHYFIFDFQISPFAQNMKIQGVTFEAPFEIAGVVQAPSDLQIVDCIFRNMNNVAIHFTSRPARRRRFLREELGSGDEYFVNRAKMVREFQEDNFDQGSSRKLQNDVSELYSVVNYTDCVIMGNMFSQGFFTINAFDSPLTINRCLFEDNSPSGDLVFWAVNSLSDVTITDSCFVNNPFINQAIRLNYLNESDPIPNLTSTNAFFGEQEDVCDLSVFLGTAGNGTCEESEGAVDTCQLLEMDNMPVAAPTSPDTPTMMAPADGPVMAPADGPTAPSSSGIILSIETWASVLVGMVTMFLA